jgi:hypothetical protein
MFRAVDGFLNVCCFVVRVSMSLEKIFQREILVFLFAFRVLFLSLNVVLGSVFAVLA